jgi:hypothetical protein
MKLSESEKVSACWVKLEKHIKEQIEILRLRNDKDIDPIATAKLRGRIFELNNILNLATSDERVVEE